MRLSAFNPLRPFGKVIPLRSRQETEAAALLITRKATAPQHRLEFGSDWRPNEHGVMVGGARMEGTTAIADQISERTDMSLSLPVFSQSGEDLLKQKRLFNANGIDSFFTWEDFGFARLCVADFDRGLLLDSAGKYGERELSGVNWERHGLVFVSPEEAPLALRLSLSLSLGR